MDFKVNELHASSEEWLNAVLNDFDTFLKDHADCERKASGMAMSLVAKYPDRLEILPELIRTGIEELEHFRLVYKHMRNRGVRLHKKMSKDLYAAGLLKHVRGGRDEGLLDRLMIAALVENRGFERFKMIADAIKEEEMKRFYTMIYKSEERHGMMFLELAMNYYDKEMIENRYNELLEVETEVLNGLEIKPALH